MLVIFFTLNFRNDLCGIIRIFDLFFLPHSSVPELSTKFDGNEHINYLSKYDFWREKEFEFSVKYR